MSTQTNPVPLTAELCNALPTFARTLGKTFGCDSAYLAHSACNVENCDDLLKWLGVPYSSAKRVFGLHILVDRNLNAAGLAESFVIYVSKEDKTQIMIFEFSPEGVALNIPGLYLSQASETATRTNIEIFQKHLYQVGCESFFKQVLVVYGTPAGGRALEAYEAALAALAEQNSANFAYGQRLNSNVRLFQEVLNRVFGSYQYVAQNHIKMVHRTGKAENGRPYSDVSAVRYCGPYFELEVSGDHAVMRFECGTIACGGGEQTFDAGRLAQAMATAKEPVKFGVALMKALLAFEMFTETDTAAERQRLRIIRLMSNQLKLAA